jgi:hypothetical protein
MWYFLQEVKLSQSQVSPPPVTNSGPVRARQLV